MPKSAKNVHHRVTWEPVTQGNEVSRSSIGGYPVLPADQSIPVCSEDGCGKPMSLFLQLAMEDRFGLPFEAGSVLSVFQCIEHDDPFEDLDTKSPKKPANLLPVDYWNHTDYALFFAAPDRARQLPEREALVDYSRLVIKPEPEPPGKSVAALNYPHIKIGGSPFWVQKPKIWSCSCGAPMTFVCSLPENLQYPRVKGSPKQPNGRTDTYFLFLGLFTYIFACQARCDPRAVVAVRQNG